MVNNSIKPSLMGEDINLNYDSDEGNLKINEAGLQRGSTSGEGKIYNIKHYRQYLFPSFKPGTAYILAIIDYFQMFNFYKVVESGLKRKFAKDAEGVSCVDPKTYSKRFIKYFEKLTDIKKLFQDSGVDYSQNISQDNTDDIIYEKNKDKTETNEGSTIELQSLN